MRKTLLWIAAALLVLVAGAGIYLASGQYAATPGALAAMASDARVTVSDGRIISFAPAEPLSTGLIYYPGGKVAPEAYAPLARALAEAGYPTFIVRMPANLAVLGINRAHTVISSHPELAHWVIGGHSLGGVMAAEYALKQPAIEGLLLYGSFVQAKPEFAQSGLRALSVGGSNDGLATVDEVTAGMAWLPDDAQLVIIPGSNHSQFGDYGPQQGDLPASISNKAAREALIEATLAFMAAWD